MEGKAVLFKKYGKVDAHYICLGTQNPDEIIKIAKALEPTYGGINLEDIKAPECFYVEEELKKTMNIPVFHDDQHGTAVISGAGLLNALEITNRDISKIKVVFSGAGAAGIACAKFYKSLGVKPENILMADSKGVIYKGRQVGMNKYKEEFAADTNARTLKDAVKGADFFIGVSAADCLTPDMLLSMADKPIIFAMANPDPEIKPELALKTRKDIIIATGRSDYDNQVNNVLGFPFIFRGALDVRASDINEEMKIAAAKALAALAKEPVTDEVRAAYKKEHEFGPNYIIPKPVDSRILLWESSAVAEAAVKSNVAGIKDFNIGEYKKELQERFK